jgi:hypothetical protein
VLVIFSFRQKDEKEMGQSIFNFDGEEEMDLNFGTQ